ncbi:DnaD domain protein [Bacillus sp. 165]|uniref:DnaD domain-containing protein n=1 Tax=Bacillus sp. 165 TaxID=1529117 RepID=UPI001ADA709A|nr:DnaD domain protein [Bacillus sp. 165]MBO9129536.1 DnaD domain protein [Bacillus sp. 165]
MAIFRQVHTDYWEDSFVVDLTPEERYFYIYLMTNRRTKQCGIYELHTRTIETDTGYNRETVEKLLERFIRYGKIRYSKETKEIMIVNWMKYNKMNSPKVKLCIAKELEKVKYKSFVSMFLVICKRLGYSIDTLSQVYEEEKEEEKEKEKEEEKEREEEQEQQQEASAYAALKTPAAAPLSISFYEKNFGKLTPFIREDIQAWVRELSDDLVVKAMQSALVHNCKNWTYVTHILKDWHASGITTLKEVEEERRVFEGSRKTQKKDRKEEFDLDD